MIHVLVFLICMKSNMQSAEGKLLKRNYGDAYNELWSSEYLSNKQKYKLPSFTNSNYFRDLQRQNAIQKEMEQARQKQIERENLIYRNHLVDRIHGSAILRDLLTMRY